VCAPGRVCARTPPPATIGDLLAEAVTTVCELGVTGEARIVRGTCLLLSLTVDESEEQTRAVMVKTAERRNQAEPAAPPDLGPWHALFHWLKHHGEHRVYIPYAGYLAESAAAKVVRMRRDFGVLLGMVEAHGCCTRPAVSAISTAAS
jgi:hypothetical protein